MSQPLGSILLLGVGAFLMHPAAARAQFVDATQSSGIGPYVMSEGFGAGVAAADFDDDGLVDFFAPTAEGTGDQLYRNLGNGQFMNVSAAAGVDSQAENRNALWFDYDADRDLDLFVTTDDHDAASAYRLYRQNADLTFEDVTAAAGLFYPPPTQFLFHHRAGNCAGDINHDGYLDLITAIWQGPMQVFLNNQDGTFTDIGISSGIGVANQLAHQVVLADFNGDKWQDLYVTVDFGPNQLWINQKNATFVEAAAEAGADNSMNDMGVALGDYDNDGDLDIYITNIFEIDPVTMVFEHNVLLRNDSNGNILSFTDVSIALGLDYGGWGWGTTFLDCNNDGWQDIAATNGWSVKPEFVQDPSRLFLHDRFDPQLFEDYSGEAQFDDTFYGSCLISFDADRDGDLDLLQSCQAVDFNNGIIMIDDPSRLRLLKNQPTSVSGEDYLVVKPRMEGPNHRAIGAAVRVNAGGLWMTRLITAGTSFMGQEPAEAFFGVGDASVASSIVLEWPDGSVSLLSDVPTNQVLTVTHGGFVDLNADGGVDESDVMLFEECFTGSSPGQFDYISGCLPADIDGDGDVDCMDYLELKAALVAQGGSAPLPPIHLFVAAMLGEAVGTASCQADLNNDGLFDGTDIPFFVADLLSAP